MAINTGISILVNAVLKDGTVRPLGTANNDEDARKMVAWANENFDLGSVVDYEYIKNPSEEDFGVAKEMMESFVNCEKNAEKRRLLEEIYDLYAQEKISGREARNRIEALYENEEEADAAIESMYEWKRHAEHDYDDDDYEDADCDDYDDDDDYDDPDTEDDEDCHRNNFYC